MCVGALRWLRRLSRLARLPRLRKIAIEPLQLLLGTMQTIRGDDFDADVELALEIGDLTPTAVLKGVG